MPWGRGYRLLELGLWLMVPKAETDAPSSSPMAHSEQVPRGGLEKIFISCLRKISIWK